TPMTMPIWSSRLARQQWRCANTIRTAHDCMLSGGCVANRTFCVVEIMTLTELKYIVAVARERHFGRAAYACFVSQPTLSVAVRKLEDELGVVIFERGSAEIVITPIGLAIVPQAQRVLEESANLIEMARQGHDPLSGPLRVGVIHTIGPYLLPRLVPAQIQQTPQMPLLLQENFTDKLLELLRQGEIDCAIVALPL